MSTAVTSQVQALASALDHCEAALGRRCDARNVHAVRVTVRRLQAVLWSMKPWIRRNRYRRCVRLLKDVASELGPLRDLDVIAVLMLTHVARSARLSRLQRRNLDAAIKRQRRELGRKFRSASNLTHRARLVRQIHELLTDAGLFRESASGSRKSWRGRVLRGVAHLGRKSQGVTREDLHRMRLLVKRCRYSLEALGVDAPRDAVGRMRDLQTALGRYCDARIAARWLRNPQSLSDAQMRKQLLHEARSLARRRADAALRKLRKQPH